VGSIVKALQALLTAILRPLELLGAKGAALATTLARNLVSGAIKAAAPLLNDVAAELEPLTAAFVKAIQTYGPTIANDVKAPAAALSRFAFNATTARLAGFGESTPDNATDIAAAALDEAFAFGMSSSIVATAFEAALPEKLNTLNFAAPTIAEMAGYAEVVKAIREPLYDAAFGKSAQYHYRSIFKPELPDEADAVQWHSRRLLTDAQLRKLFGFSGLKAEYEEPFVQSAYRALSPFILAAGFTNQDVDEAAIRGAAEFMGLRDQDVDLVVNAVETRSLQAIRNSYVQEAMTAYGQGVISDDELNGAFDDANWGQAARALGFKRALLLRRINLARDAEATIVPEVRNGVFDDVTGLSELETAGVQPWKAQMQITKADAGALIARRKKQLSEEAKAETQRVRNLKNAAIAEFQRGTIDEPGLTAALLAIPLGPLEAASIVAVQNAIRAGRLKFLDGQLRTPARAETLRIQVEAIGDQYKKELTTANTARQQLAALQVDDQNIKALLAKWGALRGKPTTTAVFNPT